MKYPQIRNRRAEWGDIERARRHREVLELAAMVVLGLIFAAAVVAGVRATDARTEAAMAVEVAQ